MGSKWSKITAMWLMIIWSAWIIICSLIGMLPNGEYGNLSMWDAMSYSGGEMLLISLAVIGLVQVARLGNDL